MQLHPDRRKTQQNKNNNNNNDNNNNIIIPLHLVGICSGKQTKPKQLPSKSVQIKRPSIFIQVYQGEEGDLLQFFTSPMIYF